MTMLLPTVMRKSSALCARLRPAVSEPSAAKRREKLGLFMSSFLPFSSPRDSEAFRRFLSSRELRPPGRAAAGAQPPKLAVEAARELASSRPASAAAGARALRPWVARRDDRTTPTHVGP